MALQHVLIADDNDAARDMLAATARSLGWKGETVASGEAALAQTLVQVRGNAPFDMLRLDWHMPGMDGLATGKAERETLAHQTPPVIIMVTAFTRDDLLREPGTSLVDAIMEKPVTSSRLYNAIAEVKAAPQWRATSRSGKSGRASIARPPNPGCRRQRDQLRGGAPHSGGGRSQCRGGGQRPGCAGAA
jgi:CheY-like chemotaxis protein